MHVLLGALGTCKLSVHVGLPGPKPACLAARVCISTPENIRLLSYVQCEWEALSLGKILSADSLPETLRRGLSEIIDK